MPRTAVVILNWNGEEHLRRFLPSVIASTSREAVIYVADNGSTDGSLELLSKEFPDIEVIKLDRNYGFAEGYDRALADPILEGTEYFVLLNSDVRTPEGWLEPLVAALDNDKTYAAVAPKILSHTDPGTFEYAGAGGGFIDRLGYPFCRGRILSTVETDTGQYDDPRTVFWATGACMAVRADVFRKLGGFDGDFFAHMEEIDFCWRAQLAEWKVGVVPSSAVYHLGGGTLRTDSPQKLFLNYRNNLYMLFKNLSRRERKIVVPQRMFADGLSAMVYLFTGKWSSFRAVWRAHRDFRRHKPVLREKREAFSKEYDIDGIRFKDLNGVYRGSVILRYIFGKRKFGDLL